MKDKKQKLAVSFNNKATIHELLPHVNSGFNDDDEHDEMAHTSWFNKDDFRRMRDADRCIIQKIRFGAPVPSDARGLEARSPIAFMEKRLAKMDGIAAVLGEQSRQKDLGQWDDESIRNRYLIATRDLVAQAIARASKDAEDAQLECDDENPRASPSSKNSQHCIDLHHQVGRSKATYKNDDVKGHKSFNALGTRKSLQYILSRASQVMKRHEPVK